MAKNKQISERFWYDPYIAEELTEPDEKLLFLYLLTNQYVSITGIYEISIRTINFDTAIPAPRIKAILAKLSQAGKVHYDMGYVILVNFHKYTSYNIPQVRNYVKELIKALPSPIQDQYSDVINNIIALANPLPSPRQPLKNSENQENSSPRQAQGKGKASPTQGQPASTPTSTPTPTNTSTSTSFPPTPQGEPKLRRPDGSVEMGNFVRHPDGRIGRKEGKEENLTSSGEGKEGRKEGRKDDDALKEEAPGVWLSENQCRMIRETYGDDALITVPGQVSAWAEEKGIPIKNGFKMCEKFAKKFVEEKRG